MSSAQYYEGIGRRKEATARVRVFPGGAGKITVNDKDVTEYMPRDGDLELMLLPLVVAGADRSYDVSIHVNGGGISGQRDAMKLGLARALLAIDIDLKSALREAHLLTRDARVKERKKPGLKRARKAPTYTKR